MELLGTVYQTLKKLLLTVHCMKDCAVFCEVFEIQSKEIPACGKLTI